MEEFFHNLSQLNFQCQYPLLRYCGLPRWTHVTRCHSATVTTSANEYVDQLARNCIGRLLGCDTGAMSQLFSNPLFAADLFASVPFVDLAPMAYRASYDGVFNLAQARSQKDFIEEHLTSLRAGMLSSSTAAIHSVHMAYFLDKGSRLWMECRPNRAEYFMRQVYFQMALRARYLLAPSNEPLTTCVCGHQSPSSSFVVHGLDCNRVRGYTWATRHALVKRVFKYVLRQYGFNLDETEPRFFENGPAPDVCFALGASLALVDVAVTNPLADSYADAESREPGFALRRTEEDKKKRYGSKSSVRDMQFFPLVLSTFGTLGVDSLTFLRKVATFTSDAPGFICGTCAWL